MPKKRIGKGSKRVSCRKRYKIEKKVRQHNKKVKKQKDSQSKSSKRRKSKKDPGVPGKCPFKEQILEEAGKVKAVREEERQKKMEQRKNARHKLVNEKRNLEGIVADAAKRNDNFERQKKFVERKTKEYTGGKAVENSLKAYYCEVQKVIQESDVIIEVLDARDPLGSRCNEMEEAVLSSDTNKKLILLLNKIDLVPKENVELWLKHLRNEFPTVAFKASTQAQTNHLSQSKVPVSLASDDLLKSSHCLGADVLMNLLSNYCRNRDIKTSITIGIVGFPNTGKSSVINSLKRSKACNVGATPGVTKTAQTIQLDKHIKLLDSPGVVMSTDMGDDATILRNCVKVESVEDPVKPVSVILSRVPKKQIMMQYDVPEYSDVTEFLTFLAKRNGKLKKGGILDLDKTAKIVLQDWNSGKIKYATQPPETYTKPAFLTTKIITDMSGVFDLETLIRDEQTMLQDLPEVSEAAAPSKITVAVNQNASNKTCSKSFNDKGKTRLVHNDSDDEDDDVVESGMEEEDDDDDDDIASTLGSGPSRFQSKTKTNLDPHPGNQQINKDRKKAQKKAKKQQRRAEVLAATFTSKMEVGGEDEEYDWEDFAKPN